MTGGLDDWQYFLRALWIMFIMFCSISWFTFRFRLRQTVDSLDKHFPAVCSENGFFYFNFGVKYQPQAYTRNSENNYS